MRKLASTVLAIFLLPAIGSLAACGGGGGGGSFVGPTSPPASIGITGQSVSIPIHGVTPATIAYQTGTSGKWTAVTPSGSSVSFTLPTGVTSYSLAFDCPMNNFSGQTYRSGPAEVVIEATTADSPATYCVPGAAGPSATVNATVFVETSSFPNTDTYSVSQRIPASNLSSGFGGTAGADGVGSPLWYSGQSDLLAEVYNPTTFTPVAARIVRNVTFTPNETVTLDPMSLTGDAITTQPANTGGQWGIAWVTAEGEMWTFYGGNKPPNVPVIPAASVQPGDYYEIWSFGTGGQFAAATGSSPSSINAMPYTSTLTYTSAQNTGDLASMNIPFNGFTVSGTKYYELTESWSTPKAPVPAGAPLLNVLASQNYLGTSTSVSVPDLSSVPGMLPNPTGGTPVAVLGVDYVASGPIPWDDLETSNAYLTKQLPLNTQFQAIQSNYFNFNAP